MGTRILNGYDEQAKAFIYIPEVENEIINGNVYEAFAFLQMDTGDIAYFGALTPNDVDIRLSKAEISADANYVKLEIWENATFEGTTLLPTLNANRQFSDDAKIIAYQGFVSDPTLESAIQLPPFATLGGTGVGQASSGSKQEGSEFLVLKRNTKYLFKIINNGGDGVTALVKEAWIETNLRD